MNIIHFNRIEAKIMIGINSLCLFVCFSWNCIRNNIYGIHSQTSTSSFVSALVGSKQLWKRLEFSCSRRQHWLCFHVAEFQACQSSKCHGDSHLLTCVFAFETILLWNQPSLTGRTIIKVIAAVVVLLAHYWLGSRLSTPCSILMRDGNWEDPFLDVLLRFWAQKLDCGKHCEVESIIGLSSNF